LCTLEKYKEQFAVRLGLRYVKGLREEIALEILRQRGLRAFSSIEELKLRVPAIQKSEFTALAEIGALNFISPKKSTHRRDALWQVERAARRPGPLLENADVDEDTTIAADDLPSAESNAENKINSPLLPMTIEERLVADFRGTGMTTGPHPMAFHRVDLRKHGVRSASELEHMPDGIWVRIAGAVIARQRPGTAKGFVFLSIEDETGIANAIITPQIYAENHLVVVNQPFLFIEGPLQHQDGVISVKVQTVRPLTVTRAETVSHDFH
jgi:error-prone DNA polymerase